MDLDQESIKTLEDCNTRIASLLCYVRARASVDWPRYSPHKSRLNFHKNLFRVQVFYRLQTCFLELLSSSRYILLQHGGKFLSLIPVSCCNLIKQTPHISISIPNHTSSFPRQLFASFLFCCCWEFWARTIQTLMVVVGNFHFERGGAFLVSVSYLIQKSEFSNSPQVQCLGLHKLKS